MSAGQNSKPLLALTTFAAWFLAILWVSPLLFAFWTAFHPPQYAAQFNLAAPWTLQNFYNVWEAAPFLRYFLNTVVLVTMILTCQFIICTMAAYAFVCFPFKGSDVLFMIVLLQLMIIPEVLLVENYRTLSKLGFLDTTLGIGLPYLASAFGIFLFRQTFKSIPKELEEAARLEGANIVQILLRVYIPIAKPTYIAYGLVTVSYHWNNFLWPLVVTNSVETRPITVGLQVFATVEQGIDWSMITAATVLSVAPLLLAFLIFQRQFVQSFMRAGIR
ncbi:MAG: carbohydrate ABC transporter permease [Methylobacteriaceae bacterium]|jgi:sn-glycerol 3-phosphate transport system permease protein|nr:carbohydrate ABC transporter permease [Methylobacteriaceae bacterium]